MHNNKLYSILTHFNKIEQNRLRKYLQSPYFNRNQALVQLYEILLLQIGANFNKDKLWKKLFPEKEYDDVRFRKLSSDLLKLVEGFLAQQIYDENPIYQATNLIAAVEKKKIQKLYKSTIRSARRISEQQFYKPANYYYQQYQIESNYYNLITQQEIDRDTVSKTSVEIIIENLDYFYIAEKLRLFNSILSRKKIASYDITQSDIRLMDSIIEHLSQVSYNYNPPIEIYYQIYLTLSYPNIEKYYYELKDLLKKYYHIFPLTESKQIYTYAINYCIQKINSGNKSFLEEFLDINENMLLLGIFKDGELSPWKFRNIVIIALRLGKYNWTEKFIKAYQIKLPKAYRENAITFNIAQLYFYKKEYEKVLELLQEVEFEDQTYNLNTKTMLLAIYYEKDEIEPLYSLMESFRVYLKRNSKDISLQWRTSYLELIKFVKRLIKVMPGEKKSIEKLKREVEATKDIASKSWLKEKIAELE